MPAINGYLQIARYTPNEIENEQRQQIFAKHHLLYLVLIVHLICNQRDRIHIRANWGLGLKACAEVCWPSSSKIGTKCYVF